MTAFEKAIDSTLTGSEAVRTIGRPKAEPANMDCFGSFEALVAAITGPKTCTPVGNSSYAPHQTGAAVEPSRSSHQ